MFTEDVSAFFNTLDFATKARYDSKTFINVIFDRAYLSQVGLVSGVGPVALCQATDVEADPTGKTLRLNSVTYTIRAIEPQDDGAIVLLRLEV